MVDKKKEIKNEVSEDKENNELSKKKNNKPKKSNLLILGIIVIILLLVTAVNYLSDDSEIDNESEFDYNDSSYIVSSKWLNNNLNKEDILILDARGQTSYDEGHIPGAIPVIWQEFADVSIAPGEEGFGVLLKPEELSKVLATKGIEKDKTIIVYANNQTGWGEDGRITWMLRMAGIEKSKMLNGGFPFWKANGYEVTTEVFEPVNSTFSFYEFDESYTLTTSDLVNRYGDLKIIDSRSEEEYDGVTNFGEARGGHLPDAISIPFTKIYQEDGTIKDQSELEKLFSDAGLLKDDEIVSYCTAGIRSAQLSLVFRMAGYTNSKNYDASFYEWAGNNELALEPHDYVDTSFIVNAEWLNKNLDREDLIILDVRGQNAYDEGHIPGAIPVIWQEFANVSITPGEVGFGVLLDTQNLSRVMGEKGFEKDKTIIVYANNQTGWGEDGRITWMLRMAGIEKSKMLDGGFPFWNASGFNITKEASTPEPSTFIIDSLDETFTITTSDLNASLNDVKILDSRSKEEYDGATNFGEARGGHLPGAIHFSFKNAYNVDGTLKNQSQLEKLLLDASLSKNDEIVTYCTAGIRSAHLSIILKMTGFVNSKNYDASFYEWAGNENLDLE